MRPRRSHPCPPRIAQSLVSALVDPADRDCLLDDLRREFEVRARASGPDHARAWYRSQALRSLWPLVARRWVDRAPSARRRSPVARKKTSGVSETYRDLSYSVRTLAKSPGYTAVAVLALALGIGASTAAFSVVDALLIDALPYPEGERVMMLWQTDLAGDTGNFDNPTPANFFDWKRQSGSFSSLAAYVDDNLVLTGVDEPERLLGYRVTGEFFEVLRVGTLLGRPLHADEDAVGADRVVVLAFGLWQRRFGGAAGIVGATVDLGGNPYEVVGVMPADFSFPTPDVDYWRPAAMTAEEAGQRRARYLTVIGRLDDSISAAVARSELNAIAAGLQLEHAAANADSGILLRPLRDELVGPLEPTLLTLVGAIGFVLAIACANVASLTLTRAAGRSNELAVRAALGASRARLGRQLFVESLVVGIAGGAGGLAVAIYGIDLLKALIPPQIPLLAQVDLDGRAFAFAAVVSVGSAVIFGFLPALNASRTDLGAALHDGTRGSVGGRSTQRVRAVLATAELAAAVALLVGAGLLVRSFGTLASKDPGFAPRGALTARLDFSNSRYQEFETRQAFYAEILERVAGLPGVDAVGMITFLPMTFSGGSTRVFIEGDDRPDDEEPVFPVFRVVTPGYLEAMGIPVRGRAFSTADRAGALPVVIVNEAFERRFWPGETALGKRIRNGAADPDAPWMTIVGVAGDVRQFGLESAARPEFYVSQLQSGDRGFFMPRDVVVRTSGEPRRLLRSLGEVVRAADPDMPLSHVATLDEVVTQSISRQRFLTTLVSVFAGAALLLAVVGVYGVMSQFVANRTREIGVRMALGANAGDVVKLMLARGVAMIASGVSLGVLAGAATAQALQAILYETDPLDAGIFAAVAFIVAGVALLSVWIPTRRAVGIEPVSAIRRD